MFILMIIKYHSKKSFHMIFNKKKYYYINILVKLHHGRANLYVV